MKSAFPQFSVLTFQLHLLYILVIFIVVYFFFLLLILSDGWINLSALSLCYYGRRVRRIKEILEVVLLPFDNTVPAEHCFCLLRHSIVCQNFFKASWESFSMASQKLHLDPSFCLWNHLGCSTLGLLISQKRGWLLQADGIMGLPPLSTTVLMGSYMPIQGVGFQNPGNVWRRARLSLASAAQGPALYSP